MAFLQGDRESGLSRAYGNQKPGLVFSGPSRGSQPAVHLVGGQHALDVIDDALGLAQGAQGGGAHFAELAVGDGEDEGVVGAGRCPPLPQPLPRQEGGVIRPRQRHQTVEPIFVLGLGAVNPGVIDVDGDVVFAQGGDDVDDAGVAQVGAVFLEG